MGVAYNDEAGASYTLVGQKVETSEDELIKISLENDLRAKTIQANGDTLEEQLVKIDKMLRRHE
jgi:hypothetical protein